MSRFCLIFRDISEIFYLTKQKNMPNSATPAPLTAWALNGIPEVRAGDDIAELIWSAIQAPSQPASMRAPQSGDIVVITSKVISKAENRFIPAAEIEQHLQNETVRVVARRAHPNGETRIVENSLGIIAAAAGIDQSNVPDGYALLLPVNPDRSAQVICERLRELANVPLAVIITDTVGRPWRIGQTDIAIGAAGLNVVDDLRGQNDAEGRRLEVTITAVADEIAAAADLVKGKVGGTPVAIVRGLGHLVGEAVNTPGAKTLQRPSDEDMFSLGSAEAYAQGMAAARAEQSSAEHERTTP